MLEMRLAESAIEPGQGRPQEGAQDSEDKRVNYRLICGILGSLRSYRRDRNPRTLLPFSAPGAAGVRPQQPHDHPARRGPAYALSKEGA